MQRTIKRTPSPGGQPHPSLSAAICRVGRAAWRASPAALLVLGLALGSAAPARATTTVDASNSPFTIRAANSPFTDDITVNTGGVLDVVTGGSVVVPINTAVVVNGGTVNISGGSVAGDTAGVIVLGGTATITGGTVSGNLDGVRVTGGTAGISGGMVSAGNIGVSVSGGTATISGGTVTGTNDGVKVTGGTATLSGGSVSGDFAVVVEGGTANISGGAVSGSMETIDVESGTATLSGGAVSGNVNVETGTLTVIGCNLALAGGKLTGILQDGSLIDTVASVSLSTAGQLILQNLSTGAPQLTCPPNVTALATSASGAVVTYASPLVSNACGSVMIACTPASGSTFPAGNTTVTCTATDKLGNTGACQFTVTVLPIADLQISLAAGASTVKSGSNLTYTLLAKNGGPFTASGTILNDPVPSGAVFVSARQGTAVGTLTTPPAGAGGAVSWNAGNLASGQSVVLTVVVKVTQKGNSTMSNTATVTSSTADPNPGNNSATVQTKVLGNSK